MAASSSSSASDSSSSSGHRDRKRHRRHRKDKDKDALKVLKKSRSHTKRRRSRHSSSDSYSSSSSSEDYSSSDSEREAVNSSKRHRQKDRATKKKDKERGKSHRQKRHKLKTKEKQQEESSGPVQLSKFLGRDKDDGVRRSAVSGKKILLKLDKTKEDKEAESKRNELLKFLNMKLEVEGLGRDYGESRLKKFPAKPSSPQYSLPDFSFDTIQKYHKENELLTERLFAMEEETKMLKEALAKRNSELQASRSMCTQTANKLQSLEAQVRANGEHRSPPKSTVRMPTEGAFSQNASLPPSLNSMSEDGNDDSVSCAGSWATTLLSELSHIKKERTFDSPHKSECVSHMELMDDFLEMEKLANLSNDMNGAVSSPDTSNARCEIANIDTLVHVTAGNDSQLKNHNETDPSEHQAYSSEEASAPSYKPASEPSPLMKLQSRISIVLESLSKEADMQKLQEDLRQIVQEVHDSIRPQSARSIVKTTVSSETASESQLSLDDPRANVEKDIHVSQDSKSCNGTVQGISKELADAMSQIHDFVIFLGKEAEAVDGASPDGTRINEKLDEFSATYIEVVSSRLNLVNFVLDLSQVLRNASELHFNILGYKTSETEMSTSDCIDKVALPENKGFQHSGGGYSNNCARFSDSSSDPDIPHEGRLVPTSESTNTSWKCSLEEFEQLELEKNNMALDLTKCTENLESTKSQLVETEQLLAEVKSQLISAQKSNSLAETQLKCMVESYRSLETRTEELQTEVNLLQAKIECLVNELQEEKKSHHEALARCQNLEEQLQRIESCPAADIVAKTNQEKELSAAAEKLAECQETIFLLGKQLRALRPQTDTMGSPWIERSPKRQSLSEEPTTSGMSLHDTDMDELDTATSVKTNSESPMDLYNTLYSPSDSEVNNPLKSPISSKHPKHRPTKSSSSSSSGGPTPEKQSRGFSRFFSSKGKISN